MFSEKLYYSHLKTSLIGRKISCFEELPSTNDYLLDGSTVHGEAVFTSVQTNGRGRSGRSWFSNSDALLFSFVLPIENPALLMPANILAGFAVADALSKYADVKLKWPNDCVVSGKKICGMLIDTRFCGSELTKAVFGIGINIAKANFPPDIAHRATSLELCKTCSDDISKEHIAADILNGFESFLTAHKKGTVDIKRLFLHYSANSGKMITVHRSGALVTCIEKGINEDGALIVTLENGETETIIAGDIGYDFNG